MIIFIEGPRNSGKTHLINHFFKQNLNKDIIHYKFNFINYISLFNLIEKNEEKGPEVHYLSVANVLTILELNKTVFKEKTIIFDRSIYSAYVWSIYRNRLDKNLLLNEFKKILESDLYQDCKLVYLTKSKEVISKNRNKDYFGQFEDYEKEKQIFDEIINISENYSNDILKNNYKIDFINNFDQISKDRFCKMISDISFKK